MAALFLGPLLELAAVLLLGRCFDLVFGALPSTPWWLPLLPRTLLLPLLAVIGSGLLHGWRTLPLVWPDARALRLGTVFVAVALIVSLLGIVALPAVTERLLEVYGLRSRAGLLTLLLVVVPLHAALGEELYYRGFLQTTLGRLHGSWGVLLPALAFAAAHGFQGWLPLLLFHLPLALTLGALLRATRSLPLLVLVHLLFDELVFLVLGVVAAEPELGRLLALGVLALAVVALALLGASTRVLFGEVRAVLLSLWPVTPIQALVLGALAPTAWLVHRGPLPIAVLVVGALATSVAIVARRAKSARPDHAE